MSRFRVGITRDALASDGTPSFGAGPLALLDDPLIEWEVLPERVPALGQDHAARYDALYVLSARVPRETVARADLRLRIVARHGVGFDSVDVPAMTEAGVIVTNTPIAIRRPVATIAITFVLALAHKLSAKDRLTRTGRWHERTDHMGMGLTGRTLGIIGAGGIGRELMRIARTFELALVASDPLVSAETIAAHGATKVDLETLMRTSDFVVVACLLDDTTRRLIGARELALMKPTAYLVNVARGPIVDERALYEALTARHIAGAALDVFEQEPTPPDNPILALDNVIVTPHSLCWTDECFRDIATSGLGSIADVLHGRRPAHIVNPDVLAHPRVRAWLGGN